MFEFNPNGDLEQLYRRHGDRLWRALLGFTGDPEVASDALAEAFAQALAHRGPLRSPLRWIWRVAFRIAAGELKDRRKRQGGLVAGEYTLGESQLELLDVLKTLPLKQRASVLLYYYAGYPIKDVARIIESTDPAVRVHLSRARKRLRHLLEESDE